MLGEEVPTVMKYMYIGFLNLYSLYAQVDMTENFITTLKLI